MKTRLIEVEKEEIAPSLFRQLVWSNVPADKLSYDDTQEFFNRLDQVWPQRESISTLLMRRIQQDKKKRSNHLFESISTPPHHEKVVATVPSKN